MRRPLLPLLLLPLALVAALAARAAAPPPAGPVSIFYYPWWSSQRVDGYEKHWLQNGHRPPYDLPSAYYPARGAYSSSDPQVVDAQLGEIAAAGVDEVASSWWGLGSPEDVRLPLVLRFARLHGLAVSVQLEPYPGRSAASVLADLAHLRRLGIRRVFVYGPGDLADADWAAVNAASPDLTLLAQTPLPGRAAAGRFAGLYTYDVLTQSGDAFARMCAQAHALRLLCFPSVGPGFDARRATGDPRVKPRRAGRTYDTMWRRALGSGADGVTITSYNEWHEGSQIEPALPLRPAAGARLAGYDGAWGLRGAAARTAYLVRTAYWTRRWRGAAGSRP